MYNRSMPNQLLRDWFDELEKILSAELHLTGLLNHASTVGQAREFLVRRVLGSILPVMAHVGSGQIIDAYGNRSKQIDLIVYDSRFPQLKTDGGGLYFVEGVLATVEVKSTIDVDQLETALENCKSVLQLGVWGEHPEEASARIEFYMRKHGIQAEHARDRFHYMFRPATYIFGFNTKLSFERTCQTIVEWWKSNNFRNSAFDPWLPRILVSGNVTGFTNDGRFTLVSKDAKPQVMTLFETPFCFRWFAMNIMDAVSTRLGLRNHAESFSYRLSEYYPLKEYLAEIQSAPTRIILTLDKRMSAVFTKAMLTV
jgi:hypothetical protein